MDRARWVDQLREPALLTGWLGRSAQSASERPLCVQTQCQSSGRLNHLILLASYFSYYRDFHLGAVSLQA